jgi:hypothetical protein
MKIKNSSQPLEAGALGASPWLREAGFPSATLSFRKPAQLWDVEKAHKGTFQVKPQGNKREALSTWPV